MIGTVVAFLVSCAVAAFVCTVIKEDFDKHLLLAWGRLFGLMVAGISAFAAVVQVISSMV